MSSRLVAVTFDARDPDRVAEFWAHMLGRDVVGTNGGALLPGVGGQLGVGFAPSRAARVGPNRMHLHVTTRDEEDLRETVDRALRLGARHLDVGQLPDEPHVVLADPGGNEFCVIPPDNTFLAGCGVLGELACGGSREVGAFWSDALGWPLVWDHDGETAVQSPEGGTKVAWGGPPVASHTATTKQRFDLVPTDGDPEQEAERLVTLGATRLPTRDDGTISMADPDGNEFRLMALP